MAAQDNLSAQQFAGAGQRTEPTNSKDRKRYALLPGEARQRVANRSADLYDGTRTVSECWKQALGEEGR